MQKYCYVSLSVADPDLELGGGGGGLVLLALPVFLPSVIFSLKIRGGGSTFLGTSPRFATTFVHWPTVFWNTLLHTFLHTPTFCL